MLAWISNYYPGCHCGQTVLVWQSTGVRWGGQITVKRHTLSHTSMKIKISVSPDLTPRLPSYHLLALTSKYFTVALRKGENGVESCL